MFDRVVIVGAGAAGTAAAWAAAQRGAEIRMFDPAFGASSLGGGAVDDRPWEEVERAAEVLGMSARAGALPESVRAFVDALGLWQLAADGDDLCRLATEAGR